MTTTNTKDPGYVATKLIDLVDRQDWAGAMELVAPSAQAKVGGAVLDRDGWRGFGHMFYAAAPDARHTIECVHVAREHATVLATVRGTHTGADFMGIPASGKPFTFDVIHVDRVVDGRVVEHRGQFDTAGFMQQLGSPPVDRVLVEGLFSAIDSQDSKAVRSLMAPNIEFRMGGQTLDIDGYFAMSKMFFDAFPDGRHVHDEIVIAGDRATVVGNFVGTHNGAFQGIAATGRAVKVGYVAIGRFAGGKIESMRVEIDSAGMLQTITGR
jgi:predicted ester cyclase